MTLIWTYIILLNHIKLHGICGENLKKDHGLKEFCNYSFGDVTMWTTQNTDFSKTAFFPKAMMKKEIFTRQVRLWYFPYASKLVIAIEEMALLVNSLMHKHLHAWVWIPGTHSKAGCNDTPVNAEAPWLVSVAYWWNLDSVGSWPKN